MTVAYGGTKPARIDSAAATGASPADRAYVRDALPLVSRTFALNIGLLGASMREPVRIAYLLCRIADTIEDCWPGDRREIELQFDRLVAAVERDPAEAEALAAAAPALEGRASPPHVELVRRTPAVLRCLATIPPEDRRDVTEAVTTLAKGMRRYAGRAAERAASGRTDPRAGAAGVVPYLDDEAELSDYCWIVAGCVGVMLTRLFTRRAAPSPRDDERLARSPVVGEGLQLTNILLDWPTDIRAGRCHVPATWLSSMGVRPEDLVGQPSAAAMELARRLEERARAALARVPEYIDTIEARHARYRQFCLWPSLWALASLRHARRDPAFPWGPSRPRLPRGMLFSVAASSLVHGHSSGGVARLWKEIEQRTPARS